MDKALHIIHTAGGEVYITFWRKCYHHSFISLLGKPPKWFCFSNTLSCNTILDLIQIPLRSRGKHPRWCSWLCHVVANGQGRPFCALVPRNKSYWIYWDLFLKVFQAFPGDVFCAFADSPFFFCNATSHLEIMNLPSLLLCIDFAQTAKGGQEG